MELAESLVTTTGRWPAAVAVGKSDNASAQLDDAVVGAVDAEAGLGLGLAIP